MKTILQVADQGLFLIKIATFSDIIFEGHLLLLTVEVKVLDDLFYYGSTYCICFETQIF